MWIHNWNFDIPFEWTLIFFAKWYPYYIEYKEFLRAQASKSAFCGAFSNFLQQNMSKILALKKTVSTAKMIITSMKLVRFLEDRLRCRKLIIWSLAKRTGFIHLFGWIFYFKWSLKYFSKIKLIEYVMSHFPEAKMMRILPPSVFCFLSRLTSVFHQPCALIRIILHKM